MSSELPIIVVCSEGAKSSLEIINNLRKMPSNENTVDLVDGIVGYKFHNVTKYYENDILFLSHESKHINLVPIELLSHVEGCIIFFDSENKSFLNKLPIYANFIENNNIEFGILLCDELYDNSHDGITYKEGKAYSYILDVIELNRTNGQDDDDEQNGAASHHDPLGYDEVLQAMRAIIWSNVNLKKKLPKPKLNVKEMPANDDDNAEHQVDEKTLEAEMSGFEALLTEVMMFKETTSNWSRNERLAYAEKFAYAFDNLLQNNVLDDSSDSESDSKADKLKN